MLVTSDHVAFTGRTMLMRSEERLVVSLAGIGLFIQIVLVFLNKIIHWYAYWGIENELFWGTRRYRWSKKMSEKFWIDIIADVATIGLYFTSAIILRNSIRYMAR